MTKIQKNPKKQKITILYQMIQKQVIVKIKEKTKKLQFKMII